VQSLVIRFFINVFSLWATGAIARSLNLDIQITDWKAAVIAVIVLGLVNTFIAPIIRLFTMPISCVTLGLFGFLINALLFLVVGYLVPGFEVRGFGAALFGSLVMGFLNALLIKVIDRKD
jgi:putative membrane protein